MYWRGVREYKSFHVVVLTGDDVNEDDLHAAGSVSIHLETGVAARTDTERANGVRVIARMKIADRDFCYSRTPAQPCNECPDFWTNRPSPAEFGHDSIPPCLFLAKVQIEYV